jgi:hypothetical protein
VTSPRWALVLVASAAVVLAACSSSPSKPKNVTTTTRAATSTTSAPTTTTTAASTTTSTAATSACSRITGSPGQGQGAAGTITGLVTSACTVNGYPTVALYSGSGAPLTVTMVNGLTVTVSGPANAAPSSFSLAPSATAQFAYQYTDVPVGSETSCPTSESASVTMPGSSTASPTFQLAIGPCGNGTIKVSPVYAGS